MEHINRNNATRLKAFRELHVEYDALRLAAAKIEELRVFGFSDEGKARCTIMYGPTGAGKSRCIDSYVESANAKARKEGAKSDPVRKLELPTKCTPKTLNGLLLRELGTPMQAQEDVPESTMRASNGIVEQGWDLIILDEAQHLIRHNTAGVAFEVGDHCKKLLDASGCRILFVGLQLIEEIMHVNKQLERRSAPAIVLPAFDFEEENQQYTFRAILREFDEALPFAKKAELDDLDLAKRIHLATGGVIGEVSRLLLDASIVAMRGNARALARSHLAETFDGYRLSGDTLKFNPFSTSKLPEKSRPRDVRRGMQKKK